MISRASPGAVPVDRGPRDRDGRWDGSCATRRRGSFWPGRARPRRRSRRLGRASARARAEPAAGSRPPERRSGPTGTTWATPRPVVMGGLIEGSRRPRRDQRRSRDAALRLDRVWHEVSPRSHDPARRVALDRPARARRTHGPKRRGEVDAAAPRGRADATDAGRGSTGRGASRCCFRTRPTTSFTRRSREEASPARSVGRANRVRRPPPARPFRRREAAAGARDRARRRAPTRPRWCASTSRPAAWTAPTSTSLPACFAGSTPRCWSPRMTRSSSRSSPNGSCCLPTARRSRTARRPRFCRAGRTSRPRPPGSWAAPAGP